MTRFGLVIVLLVLAARGAGACPPTVTVTGDEPLVRAINDLLAQRGIAIAARRDCAGITARVIRRGGTIVIGVTSSGAAPVERSVHELATAATVIESFTRDDLGAALLEPRPIVRDTGPQPVPDRAPRGIHVVAAAETSVGSDRTNWLGVQVGACIMLGPICAAARLRKAKVVAGNGIWDGGDLARHSKDMLFGLEIPFAVGRVTFAPGFAAGLGHMKTSSSTGVTGETAGLRADVHATVSVPLRTRLALDLSLTVDLTQETHVEETMQLPDEPLALVRFGVGLRYGGL
jgi:hypothetical protein